MDFMLSKQHEMARTLFKEFAEKEVKPLAQEVDETEVFPREVGKKISRAEEIRHASDYDDFYIATREKSKEQIETAEELIKMVEEYCIKIIKSI